jgi:hypothetical protein
VRGGVEQDRAERHPDRDVDRAFERHVDRKVDLRRGPAQVDVDLGSLDGHRDGDQEILVRRVGIVDEAIEVALGGVDAVGQPLDLTAQQPV